MKDYSKMTIRELRDKIVATGSNPGGMTKKMMIESLENTEKARSMSLEELYAHLVSTGSI